MRAQLQLRNRTLPQLDLLERREVPTAGLSAHLHHGVLSVIGTSPDAPIVVDVLARMTRKGVAGLVIVEGVGAFRAAKVQQVVVTKTPDEAFVVHPSTKWNPNFRFDAPVAFPVVTAPVTTAPVVRTAPIAPTLVFTEPTPTPAPMPIAPVPVTGTVQAIISAVNLARAQNGLAPLTMSAQLTEAAKIHANDMARLNDMDHTLPTAAQPTLVDRASFVGYAFSTLGENIAYNYPDATSVMYGWMNSPGHRANILGADFTQIGVAVAYDNQGSPYYCQVFGNPG